MGDKIFTKDIKLSKVDEIAFQRWYKAWAGLGGLDLDPDNPNHLYFYRRAFKAGVEPQISPVDRRFHWPSDFKHPKHPNRFVDGVDTITGKQVK